MSRSRAPLRVVLVDDDDAIAQLLQVNFDHDDRFVLVGRAKNGREAIPLVRATKPDVVLMDLSMPVLDGVSATGFLLEEDPDACVIAFTASSDPRELDAARAAGFAAILTKPFDPFALLDAVERHSLTCAERAAAA